MNRLFDLYLTAKGILLARHWSKIRSEYWDQQKLDNYHFSEMSKFLCVVNNDVPYYKEVFKSLGFNPKYDFNSLDVLKTLPVLNKQLLRENIDLFKNNKHPSVINFHTSGSTGEPMIMELSEKHWVGEQANVWRHFSGNGYRFRDKTAIFRSYFPKAHEPLFKIDKIRNFYFFSPLNLSDEKVSLYIHLINKESIVAIRGYPSSLTIIADSILRQKLKVVNIKFIHVASETLSKEDQIKIETAFCCRLSNHYGQVEGVSSMGSYSCGSIHVFEESTYTEFLDHDNQNYGRVCGTNFWNLSLPLLRYDTGDIVKFKNEKCICGRSSRVVDEIVGRSSDKILLLNREVPITSFYTLFSQFNIVRKWQIVQINQMEIKFIFSINHDYSDSVREIEEQTAEFFKFDDVSLHFDFTGNFERSENGKQNAFYSYV
jgi:phenylacetate-CoA ligase